LVVRCGVHERGHICLRSVETKFRASENRLKFSKSPPVPPRMSDWVEKVDPKSGKTYYANTATKETSWKKPDGYVPTHPPAAPAPTSSSASNSPPPPPTSTADWIEKTDPKSGKAYYVNTKTKETSWTKPGVLKSEGTTPVPAADLRRQSLGIRFAESRSAWRPRFR
jgi:hypothetical protein